MASWPKKGIGTFDLEKNVFGGIENIPKQDEKKECEYGHGLWKKIKDLEKRPQSSSDSNVTGTRTWMALRDRTRSNASPHRHSHLLSSLIAGGLHASQSNSFITSWRKKTNRDLGQRPFEPATSVCPGGAVLQSPPNLTCSP